MSSPAYDGKGQPPVALGWFSGLTTWWNGLTPQYVTHASSGISATPRKAVSQAVATIGSPDAPAGAPGKPAASSGAHPTSSGADPSTAPRVAKP